MNRDAALERRQKLVDDKERAVSQAIQAQALVNALEGAIQDCDWFISQLEAEGEGDSPSDDQ